MEKFLTLIVNADYFASLYDSIEDVERINKDNKILKIMCNPQFDKKGIIVDKYDWDGKEELNLNEKLLLLRKSIKHKKIKIISYKDLANIL